MDPVRFVIYSDYLCPWCYNASVRLHRLREASVGQADWTGHCTFSDEARFFSYRRACHRNEADYGRLVAAIALDGRST